jgi:hypothetical protein
MAANYTAEVGEETPSFFRSGLLISAFNVPLIQDPRPLPIGICFVRIFRPESKI